MKFIRPQTEEYILVYCKHCILWSL